MKIAYIGIDLFLPALVSLHKCGCEIAEIFTCETDNVTEFNTEITAFAVSHNIPYTTSRISREDIKRLKESGVEAAVCGGYYYRIPVDKELPMVNIHPSLLPMGRGSWPMPVCILRGEKRSGVTVHKIAEGFDTGDILLQRAFDVADDENLETFMEKASRIASELMVELAANFSELYKNALPQGEGEYISAPQETDWTVDSDMSFEDADRILRAFYGYECVFRAGDKKYTMIGAKAVSGENQNERFRIKDGYILPGKIYCETTV